MSDADRCGKCHHDWHGGALCNERLQVVDTRRPYDMPLFVTQQPSFTIGSVNTIPAACACRG